MAASNGVDGAACDIGSGVTEIKVMQFGDWSKVRGCSESPRGKNGENTVPGLKNQDGVETGKMWQVRTSFAFAAEKS